MVSFKCLESSLFFGDKEDCFENNPYTKIGCPVKYYIFHGHKIKDPKFTKELIKRIKETKYEVF